MKNIAYKGILPCRHHIQSKVKMKTYHHSPSAVPIQFVGIDNCMVFKIILLSSSMVKCRGMRHEKHTEKYKNSKNNKFQNFGTHSPKNDFLFAPTSHLPPNSVSSATQCPKHDKRKYLIEN